TLADGRGACSGKHRFCDTVGHPVAPRHGAGDELPVVRDDAPYWCDCRTANGFRYHVFAWSGPVGCCLHHRECPVWSGANGRCCCRRHSQHRRSEEHTSELQSRENLVCRLLLEKKNSHHWLHL